MNPSGRFSRVFATLAGTVVAFCIAGCANIFVAKHKVLVDAISAPGITKPNGKSYRLVAKKSVVNQTPVQIPVVKACVDAALAGQGMYEPPPNVAPDLFIEVGYGTETSGRIDPAARETYLQLSARDNPEHSVDRSTGTEIWDVRVAVLGIAGRVESAMPLLCAVAANYMATDTHMETRVDVPQNSPMVKAVRETAITTLEARSSPSGGTPPAGTPPQSSAGPGTGTERATASTSSGPTGNAPAVGTAK